MLDGGIKWQAWADWRRVDCKSGVRWSGKGWMGEATDWRRVDGRGGVRRNGKGWVGEVAGSVRCRAVTCSRV